MDLKALNAWEARCTQEEAPRCTAACPLHLDVRAFCGHLAHGQVDKAWSVLARSLPVPGLIARLCDAPCEQACLRREAGGALALGALERFCATQARPAAPPRPMPGRRFPVTVLGGGIASLAGAWELARRGFEVRLLRLAVPGPWDDLEPAVLERELASLERLGVCLEPAPALEPELTETLLATAKAVFVDTEGLPEAFCAGLRSEAATCATGRSGLFASPPGEASFVLRAAAGRRVAISIERFKQGIPLTTGREGEGPYRSRLVTDLSKVAAIPAVRPQGGFDPESAAAEAGRCLDCQCLTCVRHCAVLAHYKSYPKAYARQIYNNNSNVVGIRQANTMINSCMACGLCETLCPDGFSMAAVCLDARRVMVNQNRMPASAHEFALRDMVFADSEACALVRHAPGTTESKYLFFPGCQLTASDPDGVTAAYADLRQRLDGGVGLLLFCCGAPAHWSGRTNLHEASLASLREQWREHGKPTLIVACPTCLTTLRQGLPEVPLLAYWPLLRDLGLPGGAARRDGLVLAISDACAARHDPPLRQAVRELSAALGVCLVEPELTGEKAACCGYGGLLSEANPDLGRTVARQRAAAAPEDALTYCAMCRDMLARTGKRALHLFDLLFPRPGDPGARPAPGYSERRENRVRLKQGLLAGLWREPGKREAAPFEAVAVRFSETAVRHMEARRILKSDVQKVLLRQQETGQRFVHGETGHFLATLRPATVTYWVEYEETPDGSCVHNAWSHRLRLAGDAVMNKVVRVPEAVVAGWKCAACGGELTACAVRLQYMEGLFEVELLGCPGCGLVLIPEALATGKMHQVEMLLEDK